MLKSAIILAVTAGAWSPEALKGISKTEVNLRILYWVQAETRFFLYTWNNPYVPEEITDESSVASSTFFNQNDNTIILIHGHRGSARTPFNTLITDNILLFQEESYNVIVVDWERDASYSYSMASARVPFVARDLDFFLLWLAAHQSIPVSNLHLVGFGLGAHVAGIASRWYVGQFGYGVGRITGLDPSGSGWGTNSQRLRNTDAHYVEVIHTDGSGLLANGIGTAIGDINFYVNGGSNQPGCLTHSCSHNRAYELFAASMRNHDLVGFPCSSTTQLNLNRCTGRALNIGGTELYKRGSSSIYRINTRY